MKTNGSKDKKSDALELIEDDKLESTTSLDTFLERIRPEWQSRSLIKRVKRLLAIDPSSACQRLLNAAFHDLRDKIIVAGLDIAQEAASSFKLPRVESEDDLEEYPTSKLINLAYRMGLLSRPDWRRLQRAYSIRKDLEHEDDQYEAGPEDCYYIFTTAVNVVLSRDPIQLLRVTDIKELVESTEDRAPSTELLSDYEYAPDTRKEDICKYLVSTALNSDQPDIVRSNSIEMLRRLETITDDSVKIAIAKHIQDRIGRKGLDVQHAKVAYAIGAMPYLKNVQRRDFFKSYLKTMERVGYRWTAHGEHGRLLGDLEDVGGLSHCPELILADILTWLTLAYLGEQGGYGAGINRPVFLAIAPHQ
ncbi:MAG: hypothetical protein IH847_05670 [Acidobacteria bacterium]|nr:hypothetical protein [Acidobacteriota bacterium]